jgi:hypothetical protein
VPALATLTLVWLGAQGPDPAASATLTRWAQNHDAKLEAPRALPALEVEGSNALAESCETWLAQARDQLQAGDDGAAQDLLNRLDQHLRQHPGLLQASWFMAERYRLQARLSRRASADEARRFERLAEVTEGARAPAFGEPAATREAIAKVRVELVVHGARRHEVYWDGSPSADQLDTAPGEHHLLVYRGARVAWAGWVNAMTSGKIDVWAPDAAACSAEDFEGVALDSKSLVRVPPGVRCSAWIAVAPSDRPGALVIALCASDRCEGASSLGEPVATGPVPSERAAQGPLPPWAAWTLAGVGVAAATSIVLWRAGVFDPARESKVIYDGSNL